MTCGIAGTYNITCQQGATFRRTLTWTDSAKKPYDLTGFSARMQVRSTVDSSTVILSLTTQNGRISLGSSASLTTKGQVNLIISATDTAALVPGLYVYDLELVSAGGEVDRIVEGNFKVSAEVTR